MKQWFKDLWEKIKNFFKNNWKTIVSVGLNYVILGIKKIIELLQEKHENKKIQKIQKKINAREEFEKINTKKEELEEPKNKNKTKE